jgi:hypothetical protein
MHGLDYSEQTDSKVASTSVMVGDFDDSSADED